jgi:hypothetical protein
MLSRISSIFAELPRVYWTIWLGTLVNKMGAVVVPFLALYLTEERGLSKAQAGLLISLYGVGAILLDSVEACWPIATVESLPSYCLCSVAPQRC